LKRISVFCGSSPGARVEYAAVARQLGQEIARRNYCLVYGGGSVGLMGELALSTLAAGGEVIGVIPQSLFDLEVAFTNLTELRVVATMHERKAVMENISDGFIALPGGYGTFEEIFEVLTWAQLKIHPKPCGFLNIYGYFDLLLKFLDHTAQERFIGYEHRQMILVDENPAGLLDQLNAYTPPAVDKAAWAKRESSLGGG